MIRQSYDMLRDSERPSLPRLFGSKCWMCDPQIVLSAIASQHIRQVFHSATIGFSQFKPRGSIQSGNSQHIKWSLKVVFSKAHQTTHAKGHKCSEGVGYPPVIKHPRQWKITHWNRWPCHKNLHFWWGFSQPAMFDYRRISTARAICAHLTGPRQQKQSCWLNFIQSASWGGSTISSLNENHIHHQLQHICSNFGQQIRATLWLTADDLPVSCLAIFRLARNGLQWWSWPRKVGWCHQRVRLPRTALKEMTHFPRVAVGVLKQMELIVDNCRNDAKSRIAGN